MKNQKRKNPQRAQEKREKERREKHSSSVNRQVAVAREIQRDVDKFGGKSVTFPGKVGRKGAPTTAKGLVKRVGELNLQSDLGKWAQILANPWKFEGIFCPVSYNPAPSFIQTTARTTSSNLTATVAPNATNQYTIWPGHYTSPLTTSIASAGATVMDAVAYHAMDVVINTGGGAGRYVVGPMEKLDNTGVKPAIIGAISVSITLGTMTNDLNVASGYPMIYDNSLPYQTDSRDIDAGGSHSRWQLVAMGVRFRNTTPELNRGGTFITVQPNNNFRPTNALTQSVMERFPTFKDHGPEGFSITWIPRAQDLAFWHGTVDNASTGASTQANGAGIYVFVNNPHATAAMNLTYEVVCHWQLAGTYLNTVGRPGAHAPETKPFVEKAISFMQNGAHTAQGAVDTLSKAVAHNGAKSPESYWEAAARLGFKAVKTGLTAAAV